MDSVSFGQYLPIDSYVHRLDPRLKISALLLFLITIFFDTGWIGYTILSIFVLCLLQLSKIPISYVAKALKPLLFMVSFLVFFNILLLQKGVVVATIFSIPIYSGALEQSAYIVIRLALIVTITTVLTATTKTLDLTLALEDIMMPLKKIRFPAHEVAMMISIALRFIPDLLEEAKRIMKAQASRGVDFSEGSLKARIKAIITLLIPLFVSAFLRAEELANAMESRNYNPEAPRSRYRSLIWQRQDTQALSIIIIICLFEIGISLF